MMHEKANGGIQDEKKTHHTDTLPAVYITCCIRDEADEWQDAQY